MGKGVLRRSTVEYNLTDHCNLKCYACDHASPLLAPGFARLADFVRDFQALACVLHTQELRLVGGEPLLHPELLQFVKEARRIGIADTVVVWTNGVLLHEMAEEFWRSIDALHVSAYPKVNRRMDDRECARLCKTYGVRLTVDHVQQFHKSLLGKPNKDRRLVEAVFNACEAANSCLTVHDGRFYKCSAAAIIRPWLALRGVAFDNRPRDGVALHDNADLQEDIWRYLEDRAPLAACAYCLGTSGPAVPHRQLDRRGCESWKAEDFDADIAAVRARLRVATARVRP